MDQAAALHDQGARLLSLLAQLRAELRPQAAPQRALHLDSALDADVGIDSLARVELALRIEREFGVRPAERALIDAATPRDLLRALAGAAAGAPGFPDGAVAALPRAAPAPQDCTTLAEVLDWHVANHPDRIHITLLGEGEPAREITYGALRERAAATACGLLAGGLERGAAVAIMLPTGADFFTAFFGILMAGGVPVPIYPPLRWNRIEDHLRRQAGIVANCRARVLVSVAEAARPARLLAALVPGLERIASVAELCAAAAPAALPALAPGDTAFIQYTSGSTGAPKGVVLSHANLLANIRAMGEATAVDASDVFVSWLPLYHDMGLIGAWLGSLTHAMRLVAMPPQAFLARPAQWLRAIHAYRGTLSAAPNFAYEICASRLDEHELAGLDLSSWRWAFNGAEPVSPDTLARFAARFAACGFDARALAPVYGLAECAVGLAFPPPRRGVRIDRVDRAALARRALALPAAPDDAHAARIVACGMPLPRHQIRIVGADGQEAPERTVGRIEFRGPSATSGYFDNPEATRCLFDGAWLDTGDLGYLAAGELHPTGRVKDMIIRGGQHVFPQELEEAVGRLAGVRKGCVAVFGAAGRDGGPERVVVVAETRVPEGEAALRAAIADLATALLGAPADDIVLVPPHSVLKTSSGKLRRAAVRALYEEGRLGAPGAAWRQLLRLGVAGAAARLRAGANALAGHAYAFWAWSLFAALAIVAVLLAWPVPHLRWRRAVVRAMARAGLAAAGLPVAVRGAEVLARDAGAIAVANHASYLDALVLTALLPPCYAFVAKSELRDRRVLGRLLAALGTRFVVRGEGPQAARETQALEAAVRAGERLVIFAEGALAHAPGLGAFRMGAFVAAAGAGAAIVPLALSGTRTVLRDGSWRRRRAGIGLVAGTPIRPAGNDWVAALALRDAARAHILAHCGEPDAGGAAPAHESP
ncbi:MAG: AMP-binding protein [Burkholderiales bacterium]|nr:AMP-binding protein [Burkholderiales bacterium]